MHCERNWNSLNLQTVLFAGPSSVYLYTTGTIPKCSLFSGGLRVLFIQ